MAAPSYVSAFCVCVSLNMEEKKRGGGGGVVAVQRPPPKGAGLWAWRVGARWNMGCQRLIFKATHGRSSLTVKWQAWQVACTLSWILKHGTPEMGSGGTNGCPVYRIPVSSGLIDGIDGSFVIL